MEDGEHSCQKEESVGLGDLSLGVGVVEEFFLVVVDVGGDCIYLFGGNAAQVVDTCLERLSELS